MKKLLLLALLCSNGIAFSQQCVQSYNNYQPNNLYYAPNPYVQTTQIYTNSLYDSQYQTEFGQVFESIIRAISVNKVLKNNRNKSFQYNRNNSRQQCCCDTKRKNRRRSHTCN